MQLVKRIVFRRCPGILPLSRLVYLRSGADRPFTYGRPIARGGGIPAYLTYKDINIEWQVHSGQSRHTPPGHGLFSTHAKLAPLGANPVHLPLLFFSSFFPFFFHESFLHTVPSLLLLARLYPCRARLRIYSKAQPDTIKSVASSFLSDSVARLNSCGARRFVTHRYRVLRDVSFKRTTATVAASPRQWAGIASRGGSSRDASRDYYPRQ